MLGIIKEIKVDRKMFGKFYNNIKISIAACNPYVLLENKDNNKFFYMKISRFLKNRNYNAKCLPFLFFFY